MRVTSTERAALAGVVQRRREGRWRAVGTKRWSLRAGANDRVFYGKTAEQRLTSGTYRVRLTATDLAGNTSASTTIRFRVDRSEGDRTSKRAPRHKSGCGCRGGGAWRTGCGPGRLTWS